MFEWSLIKSDSANVGHRNTISMAWLMSLWSDDEIFAQAENGSPGISVEHLLFPVLMLAHPQKDDLSIRRYLRGLLTELGTTSLMHLWAGLIADPFPEDPIGRSLVLAHQVADVAGTLQSPTVKQVFQTILSEVISSGRRITHGTEGAA